MSRKGNPYLRSLTTKLKLRRRTTETVLDLFAGCGGLSLGFEAAGFSVTGYERDAAAWKTYSKNLTGPCHKVELSTDVRFPKASVIIGGPPCQPFSVNGNQKGKTDTRNGFEIFIAAVRQVRPKIWMFENVKGMLLRSRPYFDSIVRRLRRLGYRVEFRVLNAKEYGVPQNRERLIVVGWRRGKFVWPKIVGRKVTVRQALGRLATAAPATSRYVTPKMWRYVAKYERASGCAVPRDLKLDEPARTLTCRNLAGATGDMQRIRLPDGRRRLLRHREAARLQSFPDWFRFSGAEQNRLVQIGNAVPPLVAHHLGTQIKKYLKSRVAGGARKRGESGQRTPQGSRAVRIPRR